MIPDDLEALALADAIGALDAEDRLALEARVATLGPDQRAAIASLYDVALALGATVDQAEPPAHVREQVMAATRATVTPYFPGRTASRRACHQSSSSRAASSASKPPGVADASRR